MKSEIYHFQLPKLPYGSTMDSLTVDIIDEFIQEQAS